MPGVVSTSIAAELRGRRGRDARDRGDAVARAADAVRRGASPSGSTPRSPGDRARPWPRRPEPMAAGLFELRKDPITGWWVATVVDRAFHRDRFARAAEPVDDRRRLPELPPPGRATAIRHPDAQGLRVPRRRHRRGRPRARRGARPGRARAGARDAAAGGRSSRRPASTGRSTPSATRSSRASSASARDAIAEARGGRPDRLPPGRPELGRAGRRADQPPVPRPVRPAPDPAPDRRGAGRRGALRHPRGRVPVLPPRPRRGRAARTACVWRGRRTRRVRAVRLALAVRGLDRAAPPRGGLRRAPTDADVARHRRGAPPGPRPARRRASTARRTTSSSTRRRCASRSTRRTTGTGRSTRGCARSPASSWGPACRSTRSRRRTRSRSCSGRAGARPGCRGTGLMTGARPR